MNDIVARGASAANIRVVAIVAAPPALKALSECAPGLKVYTAMIDESVSGGACLNACTLCCAVANAHTGLHLCVNYPKHVHSA